MQRKLIVFSVAASLLLNAVGAAAQEPARRVVVTPVEEDQIFIAQGPGAPVPLPPPPVEFRGDNTFFMATEMSFSGRLVKGAPYSAQAVTESVQTLSDGNRIVRKNTAQLYRDTEGRTRREQTLGHIGPYIPSGEQTQTVFINDPVAKVNYILDPSSKTARKLPRMELRVGPATAEGQKVRQPAIEKLELERTYNLRTPGSDSVHVRVPGPDAAQTSIAPAGIPRVQVFSYNSKAESKTEKMEARSFDGVMAEGERVTTTIPAGEIGNEMPIQIVDERWYSPELQVVVMTRHSDPRHGETTYRLTNISRAEPAAALFQVPSDYAVKEAGGPGGGVRRTFRRTAPPPPAQEN